MTCLQMTCLFEMTMLPNIGSDICFKGWWVSLAFYFYSPAKCLVGNIGGDDHRDCWRGNNISAKQGKHCENRFDDIKTGISQISGTTEGWAICRALRKNTGQVYVWTCAALLQEHRQTIKLFLASFKNKEHRIRKSLRFQPTSRLRNYFYH